MRVLMRTFLLFSASCAVPSGVLAGTLTVASAGIFSNGVPVSTWSAPSTSWSFNFNISDTPVVSNANSVGFDVPFSNFSYFVGGAQIAVTPGRIRFFTGNAGGLLTVNLVDGGTPDGIPDTGFVYSGDQAFIGSTSSPTVSAGTYTAKNGVFYVSGGQPSDDLTGTLVNINLTGSTVPAVPEPGSLALMAGGYALFWSMRRASKDRQSRHH
jgi:hypothetical protein